MSAVDLAGWNASHCAAQYGYEACLRVLHEVGAGESLSIADGNGKTPMHHAAIFGHEGCIRVISRVLHELGTASLSALDNQELKAKQVWLVQKLQEVVRSNASAEQLMLISNRANVLEGLCAHLGVDERSGRLLAGGNEALARGITVSQSDVCPYKFLYFLTCTVPGAWDAGPF
jgi:E3 ubiquitin-protein ligase HACE1